MEILKKGFTLVELLAVIVVLGIILVIALPSVLNLINQSKIDAYNNQMELIKNAASKYMVQYANEISDTNNASVPLSKLIEKNLIDRNLKNPLTNQLFDNINITVKKINDTVTYGVSEGPELVTGMIPVYYDETSGVWKKADVNNINNNWYDYSKQNWVNAVTVTSTNRAIYQSAAVGTAIPISDINTMFVWIPRYKYLIPTGSGAREIDVVFETKYTPKSNGDAVNTYYTHPAFTFGTDELNGIWVGKFETTGSITNSTTAALTIKPDLQSVRSQTVRVMYEAIKNTMQSNTTIYGFINDNDIHMIKNTEWGAVAYLTNSIYGKYGNPLYVSNNKEIYKNNSSGYYTGRSMGTYGGNGIKTTLHDGTNSYEYASQGYYNYDGKCATIHTSLPAPCNSGSVGQTLTDKTLAYGASTTGTIYGIYDMSGGAWDHVMALYKPNPLPAMGIKDLSEYSSSSTDSQYDLLNIDSKYYDQYLTDSSSTGAILGDATKETMGWYDNCVNFAYSSVPWFHRGSYSRDNESGIFCPSRNGGGPTIHGTFRIVLNPK